MMPKQNNGRRKIHLAKMEKESNLNVTFSKRRPGLFKKASELCTLCGAEVAIVVFSPSKKPYSFGHPSLEIIVERFLAQNSQPNSSSSQLVEAYRNANINELYSKLTCAITQLDVERNRNEQLTNAKKQSANNYWWEAPIESLSLDELERFKVAVERLKKEAAEQKNRTVEANQLPLVPISGDCNHLMGSGPITMTPHGSMMGFGHFNG